MKHLRALRALARIEVRQLTRHRARSLLVILLIAIPVAAVVGGSTLAAIIEPDRSERRAMTLGAADLRIDGVARYEDLQRAQRLLPESAKTMRVFIGVDEVRVPGRRMRGKLFALPGSALDAQGMAAGTLRVTSGRAPENPAEVALSTVLLAGLGCAIGDTVTLEYGPHRVITGTVVDPEAVDTPVILRTPSTVEYRGQHRLLVSLPDETAAATAEALRGADFVVITRAEAETDTGILANLIFVLGTLGFLEAALVIAAAFAVSLRRRQYEIGLLGAGGASVKQIALGLLVSAAVLATVGAALGIALGLGGAALLQPWLDDWNRRLNGAFTVPWWRIAGAVTLGILTAVAAALLPARTAARVPIRDALAGRRPTAQRSNRWLGLGVTMIGIGLALLLFAPRGPVFTTILGVIVGPILGVAGFGVCSPWVLEQLARGAARLPLAWRLAVRDSGRFRVRNGAVVTAVLAGMAMSVTVSVLVTSLEAAFDALPPNYRADHLLIEGPQAEQVAARIMETLPARASTPLTAVYSHGQPVRARYGETAPQPPFGEWIACGDADILDVYGVEHGQDAFRVGKLLALDPGSDPETLQFTTWVDGRPIDGFEVAAVTPAQVVSAPRFLLNRARLAELDLEPAPPLNHTTTPWLLRLEHDVTPETLQQAQQLAAAAARTTVSATLENQRPTRAIYHAVLAICALTGLIIVLIATALSAAESADDERVLHTIGAAPRLVRRQRAARSAYLALLGCALAVPAGILPAIGIFAASNVPLDFIVPWRDILLTVTVLPLSAYAAAWCFGPSQHPVTRRSEN